MTKLIIKSQLLQQDFPEIKEHGYRLLSIISANTHEELDAAGEALQELVPANHPEYPLLCEIGSQKREELNQGIDGVIRVVWDNKPLEVEEKTEQEIF